MVRSMTGFGRVTCAADGRELTLELKSVNHRFLDLSFKMPRSLSFLEDTVRKVLSQKLSRGHIDVYAYYRNTRTDAKTLTVDKALLDAYIKAVRTAASEYELNCDLTATKALHFQDVLTVTENDEDTDALKALMTEACCRAADELIAMRMREGENIAQDLISRVDKLASLRDRIAERAPIVVDDYRQKLDLRIASLLSEVEVDRAGLATEIALFADKANIDEELVRLLSHFKSMRQMLESDEAVGRKLDFLVQEMNREFNTIGSKANDDAIAKLVIDGKAEIEKIREQVQNIE